MAEHLKNQPDINSTDVPNGDVILKVLRDQLLDLYKDIELNYRRVYFKNPVISMLLKHMADVLKKFAELLEMKNVEAKEEAYTKKDKFTFGTTKESIR